MALDAGQAAYESEDWLTAYKQFQEYLGRNPDDVEFLKKYAKARLSIRPLDVGNVMGKALPEYGAACDSRTVREIRQKVETG